MAFEFALSLGDEKFPILQLRPTTASEVYASGEALVFSSGALTKCGQTTKPVEIAGKDYIAPSSGNLDIPSYSILPEYIYRTKFAGNATATPEGVKVTLDPTGKFVTGSTGTHQYTTATAAGTVTTAGNAAVTVTSALLDGGSKDIAAAVALDDNAAAIADKIRVALAADRDIAANFAVSGSAATIVLTPLIYAEDDATLNIAIDDGTGEGASEGITAAPTSVTTAGVASTGVATIYKKLGTGAEGTDVLVRFI